MKKLRISRLTLENFKGVRQLEVILNGCNATISGQNGAGKTTVADAYTWAMTGKMTDGKTAEIGYYDSTGTLDTEASHIVEVEFTDGTTFRKETNGSTKFYASGVPVKATEYIAAVRAATNDTVSFLAMPQSFCNMHWSERRKILMSLVDITEAEVIASTPELEPFSAIIANRSPEQVAAVAKDQRKKFNAELALIPARIEEANRTVKPTRSTADIETQITETTKQLEAKSEEVKTLQKAAKKALEPFNVINEHIKEAMEIERGVTKTAELIERNDMTLGNLRTEWKRANEAANGKCPTCGAKVASDRLPEFTARLDRLAAEGKRLAETQVTLKREIDKESKKAEDLRKKVAEMQAKFDADSENDTVHDDLTKAIEERDAVQAMLSKLKIELLEAQNSEKAAERIKELRQRETELGAQIAELDRQLYLAEIFTKQQIQLTEDAINAKFEVVKWKMFEEFKAADGVRECCEPTINGVPYGGNLSKGERLKAALDILRAIQTAYGVELPIFVDDAECYTSNSHIDLPNQIIRLKAAEGVKILKVDLDKAVEQPQQMSLFEGSWTA